MNATKLLLDDDRYTTSLSLAVPLILRCFQRCFTVPLILDLAPSASETENLRIEISYEFTVIETLDCTS